MIGTKKQTDKTKHINPVVAAVAGAVVGVGAAVAGAVVLQDEKNRKKVQQVLGDVRDQAMGYVENLQKQATTKREEIEDKITEGTEKLHEMQDAAKDSLSAAGKHTKKITKVK